MEIPSVLSQRQEQIARLVAEGLTNKEIAAHMGLAHQTVKNYLLLIFLKLQIDSRVQLARYFWSRTSGSYRRTSRLS